MEKLITQQSTPRKSSKSWSRIT